MSRGILLAGNESALFRAIEAETANRTDKYAAALIANRLSGASKNQLAQDEKRLLLEWNPSSPISARTLVLAAENRLECLDEAILICSPPSVRCNAAELSLSDVEILVNDHIKGWFLLVKELASVFSAKKKGTLALVYPDINLNAAKDDAADILGPAALASFRALAHGLLSSAYSDNYITMGFSNSEAGNETAFASYMYKNLDETTKRSGGKLFKFGKFSFFK